MFCPNVRRDHLLGTCFVPSIMESSNPDTFSIQISGFTALPGIINKMSPGLTDGIYWVPQIVGGCGFVVSGTLFMLETQKKWYIPALGTLGWHIGFWNWIGGIGFTLCPCLGLDTASWAQYQASCSTVSSLAPRYSNVVDKVILVGD